MPKFVHLWSVLPATVLNLSLDFNFPNQPRWSRCVMTSPRSMLIPNCCVCKGQYSIFNKCVHLFTRCLTGISKGWHDQYFSQMCVYSTILQLKVINSKHTQVIKLPELSLTRDLVTMSRVALRELMPPGFLTGWYCAAATNLSILTRIPGISDIGDWSHRYGYVYFLQ